MDVHSTLRSEAAVNITHFVESLDRGGLERVVIDLVRAQRDAGYRCQVVCLFEAGALAPELVELGIPVLSCGKRRGLDLRAILRARQCLRRHGTQILHTHNAISHYYAVLASRGLPLHRVVNTRHGMGATRAAAQRSSRGRSWRDDRLEWLYGKSMAFTHAIATVCETARREFQQRADLPAQKILAVPNGIHVDRFAPASADERQRLRETLGVPEGTRLAGFVGRLTWAKDHATLIRAFGLVRERCPDAALVLIGDGPLRGELEALARAEGVAERVFFLGDRNDIHALLRGLDLFVMSSVTEGYSVALLEACASALPIVATNVGGNAEIVRDGANGTLVGAGDPAALAAAMTGLLANDARARAMGRAGRDWVLRHGSFRTMAQRYSEIYGYDPGESQANAPHAPACPAGIPRTDDRVT
ncbi:glycosyltransferase [Frateuria terrea]|uniref:Glycosyltransferase involved in cell wall bisynthesis n=1 Tax=Frateuria terrea TaxID=529704 RepID=A0A1H6VIT6_9GAMM|nr:glycosyltransferase [Frateuria terrea]SEJ02864.1 Glycosyltransferase involved in cell wall bisynthesis [Frateuria terrea]SFP64218.1 Glycosyltransferase involved in cell wall bisynthesis [Frateuria terrea]